MVMPRARLFALGLSLLVASILLVTHAARSACVVGCRDRYMNKNCASKLCYEYTRTDCRVCDGAFGPYRCDDTNKSIGATCAPEFPDDPMSSLVRWDRYAGCEDICECVEGVATVEAETPSGMSLANFTSPRMICK